MMRPVLSSELARGQAVIVVARWLLVLVGLLVAVWNPESLLQLRIQVAVVLLVAIANFVMHAQLLRRRPTIEAVAYAASLGDLLVIGVLIASQGGFDSNLFVFFFPAVLAIAVAFPTRQAVGLGGIAVLLLLVVSSFGHPAGDEIVLRAGALGAVAVIGNAYWRLHRSRIRPSMRREDAQDLFWGQVVTLWARWAIIGGAALLVLARASTTQQLAVGILPVVALLVVNFYLHGRYLLERPANASLTGLAVGLDLAVLAALFVTAPGAAGPGNPLFVLLYPLVFGVGLVFPPRLSWPYTAAGLIVYTLLVVSSGPVEPKVLVVRLVTVAAMGGLGSLYWRIVRRESGSHLGHDASQPLAWEAARAG